MVKQANFYITEKHLGETPLEALTRLRGDENIPENVPMTYAGRLDPAAEGLLIILVGEECKNKEYYSGLSKTYQAEILLGVSTDSYDLLGLPRVSGVIPDLIRNPREQKMDARSESGMTIRTLIQEYFKTHLGKQTQTYPPYSSKTVDGVQLHTHTKNRASVDLPTHEVSLDAYENLEFHIRTRDEAVARAIELADMVKGDFRQAEIAQAWRALSQNLSEKLSTISVTLTVSSGFYIRQLAEDLGRELGVGACLYSLVRTKIGEEELKKA